MKNITQKKYSIFYQYILSVLLIAVATLSCYFFSTFIGYKTVALILLMTVSVVAMLFDILPVLIAAILSAISWNFFFIPPVFTFHIGNTEDLLMFLLYFFISLVNVVLTLKIRAEETKARDKEEKENTIKLYNTLFNSLSHELKTPISTIIATVDLLKENSDKISKSNQTELINQIDIASIRLNRQLENLLNMSRLETGTMKPNLDWCDVNELIYAVIQKNTQTCSQSIVFEQNDKLPFYKFDRGLIEQVIQNLLLNAINYTPIDSIISIEATEIENECAIRVSDNGNGIPELNLKHIFDKFYRLPNTKTGGCGLGLSIAKGFVEAHNGTIKVENNSLGGATFVVMFPAEKSYINHLKNE